MRTGTFANPVLSGLDPSRVPQPYGAAIPEEFAAQPRAEAERTRQTKGSDSR
jgi:hypothetical protein